MSQQDPAHPSLKPLAQLLPNIRQADEPFVDAIRAWHGNVASPDRLIQRCRHHAPERRAQVRPIPPEDQSQVSIGNGRFR